MKKLLKITFTLFFTLIIVFGFALPLNPPNGTWQQQFIPNLNNRPISGITFADSLTGYAITGDNSVGDTNYIVKTTDGGNSWNIIYSVYRDLSQVKFLNKDTGFVSGGYNATGSYLIKTTNGGLNWNPIITPNSLYITDMHVLNVDTMWIMDVFFSNSIYRTTNGGAGWVLQYSNTSSLRKIYFYNNNIGFMCTGFELFKTTDSGFNWVTIPGESRFRDMHFTDSMTGWKADFNVNDTNMRKTTNGGLNWVKQQLPKGGMISNPGIYTFSKFSKDTIWGCGAYVVYPNSQIRGILYRTTNGGSTWYFQIPDTASVTVDGYIFCNFINKNNGWFYLYTGDGIHTTNGGDTNFILGLQQISNEIPKQYLLYQNYPNPFNPTTNIKFDIPNRSNVKISIYDILGKEIAALVNEELNPGTFEVNWDASNFPSGVYFYKIVTDGFTESKKMILIK